MTSWFSCRTAELVGLPAERLADPGTLAALVIAAAGATGITTDGPPVVRGGLAGAAVGVVGVDGHILLHTAPSLGSCIVDIVVRAPRQADRALDVIARRLGARPPDLDP
jgi:S-adenosylmethionine/arginine decarboxylase-like enzyme